MPRHRQVIPLQTLCLRCVGSLVASMAPIIIQRIQAHSNPYMTLNELRRNLERLKEHVLSHVPYCLHNALAVEVLQSIRNLIDYTKKTYYPQRVMSAFLTEMNVIVSLTEVVMSSHLKQINFSDWPRIMRYVIYSNLPRLDKLEILNMGSCMGSWTYDNILLQGLMQMKNLRSLCICFDCTDLIVQALSENCSNIVCLDITSSKSVTDRSVPYLLNCVQLRELQLYRTSVTSEGLARILVGLPKLRDIGKCDEFGMVMKHLYQTYPKCGPFNLKKIQTRGLSTEQLRTFVDMFPKVECFSLFHENQMADLTVLTSLDNLTDLKLLSCAFYGNYLKQLLEVRGNNITTLHLEHVEEISFNVLRHVSQYCPRLKNLVLYNCDFVDNVDVRNETLAVQPFFHLEKVFWVVDWQLRPLEFVLTHAVNLRHLHLGSSTGITHSSIENILSVNPLKCLEELRILYGNDLNMRTVRLLLSNCMNLKVLSELESWLGITIEELKNFRDYIRSHNFDLDIRPTLSYY